MFFNLSRLVLNTRSDLFLALPNELVLEIITPLPIHDIIGLRLVSKAFHTLITFNESPLATYHSQHTFPPYTLQLYPLPGPTENNLHYVCSIWQRLTVAAKLATHVANYAAEEMFLKNTVEQRLEFESKHRRMRQRLLPLVFVLFHYLETSRDLHVRLPLANFFYYTPLYHSHSLLTRGNSQIHHLATGGIPLNRQAYVLNPLECQVMRNYDDQMLLETRQAFPLIFSALSRHLRPEMYVGALERSKKGYANDWPPDEAFVTILAIGGPRQAQKFWEADGYKNRRDKIDRWYRSIIGAPDGTSPQQVAKKISRLYTFGRKKSTQSTEVGLLETNVHGTNCTDWFCVEPSCIATRRQDSSDNLVFHSSLSSGPPMGPLKTEQLQSLLPDLPLLRDFWTPTAEVLLLERGVVTSTQEIKQNSQVLLDLIRNGETETDRCFSLGMAPRWFL